VALAGEADRRLRIAAITAAGKAKVQAALPLWRKAQAGAAAVSPLLVESRLPVPGAG